MNVYIQDVSKLRLRILAFMGTAKNVLNNRREWLWTSFVMKNGKCRRVSLETAKKNFKAQWIDRYQKAFDCLGTDDFTTVDWIDFRDVLYTVLYNINMQDEKSMKALRDSKKDIVIEVYGNDDALFNNVLERFTQRL